MNEFVHSVMCAAAMTRPVPDCQMAFRWRSRTREVDADLLRMNGWRLAAGRWVCPANHRPDLTPACNCDGEWWGGEHVSDCPVGPTRPRHEREDLADPSWIPEDPR